MMFGLFELFGRSRDIRHLDQELRTVGLHPRIVPDAVKLATVRQVKEACSDAASDPCTYASAAELLGYCMLGREAFTESNDSHRTKAVEARLVAAIEAGDSADARLVLLTLHAGVIEAGVVERYELSI
ncbi:MAG: hypothetical protein WD407_05985 [Rhodospirillales bacterium]